MIAANVDRTARNPNLRWWRGELWLIENMEATGVPVSVQVGATLNFLAGHVRRAPSWIQRFGIEWVYRMYAEPTRLVGRYWSNGLFALRMLLRSASPVTAVAA